MTDTITITVDADTAKKYREATADERRSWDFLVRVNLQAFMSRPPRGLKEVMDDLGREAEANGMTDEILADILTEWDEERRR